MGKAGFMIQTDARVKKVPRALSKSNYFPPWNSFEHLNLVMGAALTQLLQNLEIEFVYPVNNKPESLLLLTLTRTKSTAITYKCKKNMQLKATCIIGGLRFCPMCSRF